MAESQLKKVACPSCGAPLLFGAGEITVRCQFCNAVIERPLQPDQPAKIRTPSTGRKPSNWPPPPPTPSPSASPAFARTAALLGVLLAVGIGVLSVFLIVQNVSTLGLEMRIVGPAVLIPTEQPDEPEFIALVYDTAGDTYRLTRLNPARGKVVWRGKSFEEISDVERIAVDGTVILTIEGRELHAYRAADGGELWQTKLSDKIGYCDECLSAADGRAVVLTQDYVIEVFDSKTGESAWKRRMDGYTDGFTIGGGGLWLIDKADDHSSLFRLSLADGSVEQRITPECARSDRFFSYELDSITQFFFDPDPSVRSPERSVFFVYGWSPSCVERWDAAGGTRIWQTEDDEGYTPSRDLAVLLTPDTLFFSYEDTLWSASTADGAVRVVSEGGDYELIPLALEQGILILRTKRTRGTAQFGLRGVDPQTGDIRWEYNLENAEPLDPPDASFPHVDDDRSIFLWRMVEGQIRLAVFQTEPNQIVFDTIDPVNGSASGGESLSLGIGGDSYFGPEPVAWKGTAFWFLAGSKLIAVDIAAMNRLHSFP